MKKSIKIFRIWLSPSFGVKFHDCLRKKTFLNVSYISDKRKVPDRVISLSRTNKTYPRYHLDSRIRKFVRSSEYYHIPGNLRMPTRCRILCIPGETRCPLPTIHLTAPSAVHLTICFSPDSQLYGFSVQA